MQDYNMRPLMETLRKIEEGTGQSEFYQQFYLGAMSEGIAHFYKDGDTWYVEISDSNEEPEDLEIEHKYFAKWRIKDHPGTPLAPDEISDHFLTWFQRAGADITYHGHPSISPLAV